MNIFTILIPILLADIVNPVLFASMVYATGSARPVINSIALLLGHTLAYFCAGVVVALGLERITHYLANPGAFDYVLGFVIGLLLLWVALASSKKSKNTKKEREDSLSPLSAFGMGAVVNFVGIPFALPYFAAVDQILKANLGAFEALAVLTVYNVLYALPFLIVPVLVIILGTNARPLLQKINGALDRVSAVLMPFILGLVGLALLADALLYFTTGNGLF